MYINYNAERKMLTISGETERNCSHVIFFLFFFVEDRDKIFGKYTCDFFKNKNETHPNVKKNTFE